MKTCFYTCYDGNFKDTAKGLVNSIKKFYPDIPVVEYELGLSCGGPHNYHGNFDLMEFCNFHLRVGRELLDKYDRVISVDADHIMANECPELFGDFDLGVVQNNTSHVENYDGSKDGVYVNAGLTVCTNKDVWDEWTKEYQRMNAQIWSVLNEQNALNEIYHKSKHNVKLLEFPNKVYGITGMKFYEDMFLINDNLYLPNNKALCMFHAAGDQWKNGGKINFNLIKDEKAREKLKGYTL
jgi:hypothetical protein